MSVKIVGDKVRKKPDARIALRLFVSGASHASLRAIARTRKMCEERFKGRFELDVVDLKRHPEAAAASDVIATPLLVKESPAPFLRIVGDLSDQEKVLLALDLETEARP